MWRMPDLSPRDLLPVNRGSPLHVRDPLPLVQGAPEPMLGPSARPASLYPSETGPPLPRTRSPRASADETMDCAIFLAVLLPRLPIGHLVLSLLRTCAMVLALAALVVQRWWALFQPISLFEELPLPLRPFQIPLGLMVALRLENSKVQAARTVPLRSTSASFGRAQVNMPFTLPAKLLQAVTKLVCNFLFQTTSVLKELTLSLPEHIYEGQQMVSTMRDAGIRRWS